MLSWIMADRTVTHRVDRPGLTIEFELDPETARELGERLIEDAEAKLDAPVA